MRERNSDLPGLNYPQFKVQIFVLVKHRAKLGAGHLETLVTET